MLEWITENNRLIIALANIGTLAVWIFYAQLLYNGYSRQRRPRVMINKGVGNEFIDSPCLICNMSQESVFIYFIVVQLKTSEGLFSAPMTDSDENELSRDEPLKIQQRTLQGPLKSGTCLETFSFHKMIERIARREGIETRDGYPCDPDTQLEWIELHVISIYGSDNAPFGAVRRFEICGHDEDRKIEVRPTALDTSRKTSRHYRRQIKRWLEEYL